MGIFAKFFTKEKKFAPANLSVLHTDLHSHFIPGIDDGSKSMEETLALLQEFQNLGYKKVVTTPHIMSDFYKNTPEIILAGLEKVKEAIKDNGLNISIEAAAEYYLDLEFEKIIEEKKLLTFGKNLVLFELPFVAPAPNFNSAVFKMQTCGYQPVLAHVERYSYWHFNFNKFYELKEKGILFQLNINSLSGHYSLETKKTAERLIDENLIDFIGSDCHNINHVNLTKKCLTEKYLHKLLDSNTLLNKEL
jgi:protein-tyrosine phosphatase